MQPGVGRVTPGEVEMGQDHAPVEARLNGRIRQHGGKIAEDDALGGRAPARIGRVLAIEAVNLPVWEPGGEMGVRATPPQPELDEPARLAPESPRREIDAVALGDLLLDVEVELAHDGQSEHTPRLGQTPRGAPAAAAAKR
jgi:hypothetical protein